MGNFICGDSVLRPARRPLLLGMAITGCLLTGALRGDTVVMRDGRQIEGRFTYVNAIHEGQGAGPAPATKLVAVGNDGLRYIYFPKSQIAAAPPAPPNAQRPVEFDVPQQVAVTGQRIGGVGGIIAITPWDPFGRRIFSMNGGPLGRLDVVQGITKITPVYCTVEALQGKTQSYVWKMQIATSSIPREVLSAIIERLIDPKDVDQRLKVVKLLLQQERYRDAEEELKKVAKDFPDRENLKDVAKELKQSGAQQILNEIEIRSKAGQHQLAYSLLERFPSDGVAGAILQQVQAKLDTYNEQKLRGESIVKELTQLAGSVQDPAVRDQVMPLIQEITNEMRIGTLDRMATYSRFAKDSNSTAEHKLSLAISGWLMGANDARENLTATLALAELRNLIAEYMKTDSQDKLKRDELLDKIKKQEFASPPLVAAIVAKMPPVLELPEPKQSGSYELSIPSLPGEPDIVYHVQLPPEYDPHGSYPCVISLHGANSTPEAQIEWWAGADGPSGQRVGQASRHGYIIIAPAWAKPHQKEFESSAREHHAVLGVLRDACRHFAIDTDRVFLSGHSMGGTAAWEIGLAHPDLWAGVIPIVGAPTSMTKKYWPNAEFVSLYFVGGEKDGDTMLNNGTEFERYMNRNAGFDATSVEFVGRGHEHFSDEIIRIFDWMNRKRRNFFPRDFKVVTQRETDSFFWWVELPTFQPPPRPMQIESRLTANNGVIVQCGVKVALFLSPEIVDFSRPITVTLNGKPIRGAGKIQPDIAVILEDARSRGVRKHPFWAKVE